MPQSIKSNMNSLLYSGTADEKKALNEFCGKWLADSFWPFKEFELSLKIPGSFLLFMESTDGWAGLSLGRSLGGVSELFFIFVRPDSRGQGYATRLLSDFESHSERSLAAESVMLEVRPTNVSAIRLYEAAGYLNAGLRRRYYKDGEDALIYSKSLHCAEGSGE